jgi:opacity protein-like surface antigen
MKRTAVLGLLALASALASLAAQADVNEPVLRVGVAASFGSFQGDDVPDPSLGDKFIDDNAVGLKAYGQYQFNNWFGIEGAYHSTGEFEDTSSSESLPGKLSLSFTGFSAQGLLFVPLPSDELQAYVKAGYYDFDAELGLNSSNISSSSETGLVFGAGALIDIGDNLAIRADLDVFDAKAGDLLAVNLGVQYSFGGSKDSGQ